MQKPAVVWAEVRVGGFKSGNRRRWLASGIG